MADNQQNANDGSLAALPDIPHETALSDEFAELTDRAKQYARNALADNTRLAYGSDIRDFETFCKRHSVTALPATPQTVARYVTALAASVKPSTIERRIAAIRRYHRDASLPDPTKDDTLKSILRGIAREHGAPAVAKRPMTDDVLHAVVAALERQPRLTGNDEADRLLRWRTQLAILRDRALVLLGFVGAFRRSELVALDVTDLQPHQRGLRVRVRKSKTDQEQRGRTKAIPRAPIVALDAVRALEDYQAAWNIVDGPLFRSCDIHGNPTERRLGAGEVARLIKRAAKRAGLDPDIFAGHSLRSGFVTAAASKGASIPDIAEVSHQSKTTVLRYWKAANDFASPPLLAIFDADPSSSKVPPGRINE